MNFGLLYFFFLNVSVFPFILFFHTSCTFPSFHYFLCMFLHLYCFSYTSYLPSLVREGRRETVAKDFSNFSPYLIHVSPFSFLFSPQQSNFSFFLPLSSLFSCILFFSFFSPHFFFFEFMYPSLHSLFLIFHLFWSISFTSITPPLLFSFSIVIIIHHNPSQIFITSPRYHCKDTALPSSSFSSSLSTLSKNSLPSTKNE